MTGRADGVVVAFRDWLRGLGFTAYAGGSGGGTREVVVTRVGGRGLHAGVDDVLVGLDVWGDSYRQVEADAARVTTELDRLERTEITPGVVVHGAHVASNVDQPDPTTNHPRRALTVHASVTTDQGEHR